MRNLRSNYFQKSKYKNKKCEVFGQKFDSLAEGEYYAELLNLKACGDIVEIQLQPKVYLTTAKVLYKPDFYVKDKFDRVWYVDVKGMATPVFNIKKRLWKHYGDAPLRIVKKVRGGFELIEEVISTQCGL